MSGIGDGVEPVVQLGHTEETEHDKNALHQHSSYHLQQEEIDDEKRYFAYVLIEMHNEE